MIKLSLIVHYSNFSFLRNIFVFPGVSVCLFLCTCQIYPQFSPSYVNLPSTHSYTWDILQKYHLLKEDSHPEPPDLLHPGVWYFPSHSTTIQRAMLPGSRNFSVLSLSTFSTISIAHLLKPCISAHIFIPFPYFIYSLPDLKKSGLEIIFFHNVEHKCSIVTWFPEVLLRLFCPLILSVMVPPSPIIFLTQVFWVIMVVGLSVGLFSTTVLGTEALSI